MAIIYRNEETHKKSRNLRPELFTEEEQRTRVGPKASPATRNVERSEPAFETSEKSWWKPGEFLK